MTSRYHYLEDKKSPGSGTKNSLKKTFIREYLRENKNIFENILGC